MFSNTKTKLARISGNACFDYIINTVRDNNI